MTPDPSTAFQTSPQADDPCAGVTLSPAQGEAAPEPGHILTWGVRLDPLSGLYAAVQYRGDEPTGLQVGTYRDARDAAKCARREAAREVEWCEPLPLDDSVEHAESGGSWHDDPGLSAWREVPESPAAHVYVHIWGDNANVYGAHSAALDGIAESCPTRRAVEEALYAAEEQPGEPAYLDGGMSTVRYLSVEGSA